MENCPNCISNLRVLDLHPPVTQEQIKAAHRDLAKVWHPDRFQGEPKLAAKAEEQFKRIQLAYQELVQHLPLHDRSSVGTSQRGHGPTDHPPNDRATAKDYTGAVLTVLIRWADGDRFFMGSAIPQRLRDQVEMVYHDSTNLLLGVVDISMTGTGRTFLAFVPHRIVFKGTGFSGAIRRLDYDEFLKKSVVLKESLYEPDFFDRLAYDLGIGRQSLPQIAPLTVELGHECVSDGLGNEGATRLYSLLQELKETLKRTSVKPIL